MAVLSADATPSRPRTAAVAVLGWRYALAVPVAVFLVTRVVAAVLVLVSSRHQIALGPSTIPGLFVYEGTPADPGYLAVTRNWDGQWYQLIATEGYHHVGPGEVPSHATVWAWAFPPVYPLVVGGLMHAGGLSFAVASTLLNLTAGAAAMVLLHRLLEETGGRWVATSGVILSCCFMSAPLFQAAYSESLAFLFLLAAFHLVRRRAYWLALLPTGLLSFTRLITPVLAVVVVAALVHRVRTHGWSSVSGSQRLGAAALAAYSAAGALAWPTLASSLMGDTARFNRGADVVSGLGADWFATSWASLGLPGIVLVLSVMAVLVISAVSSRSAAWGFELRVWSVAYPLYVMAVTPITAGVLRYALLAPTLGLLAVGIPRSGRPTRGQMALVVLAAVVGLVCQWLFVRYLLVLDLHPLMP
ncbi:hypothetical protein [Pedococcus sp. 5OH_020]|uniref:hypothetical protein n=1 Tax=Pedococcus sp. 5OH_020 TaxID=2989814 RepID=UPI0022E9D2B3|nr:hypothetical protein [Pedococcus sp. 5OH_020]